MMAPRDRKKKNRKELAIKTDSNNGGRREDQQIEKPNEPQEGDRADNEENLAIETNSDGNAQEEEGQVEDEEEQKAEELEKKQAELIPDTGNPDNIPPSARVEGWSDPLNEENEYNVPTGEY